MLTVYSRLVNLLIGSSDKDPLKSYQAVVSEVCNSAENLSKMFQDIKTPLPPVSKFRKIEFPIINQPSSSAKSKRNNSTKVNYALRQEHNTRVGSKGETAAIELLKQLYPTRKIEQVSSKDDSLGYDIQVSGKTQGEELYVEVKTTSSKSQHTPFFISARELEQAKTYGRRFLLLRLYDIDSNHPSYYMMTGDQLEQLSITPVTYIAEVPCS